MTRLIAAAMAFGFMRAAAADPLQAPTVDYIADVEITRDSDFSVAVPARYIYSGRRMRIELVGIVTLVDIDKRETVTMIPRVRTYWRPRPFAAPAEDGRRWIGVEAKDATPLGETTLFGRNVTKYYVHGSIFDTRTPFEGEVWTTAENIVVRVDGTGTNGTVRSPIKVSTVQLWVGPGQTPIISIGCTVA